MKNKEEKVVEAEFEEVRESEEVSEAVVTKSPLKTRVVLHNGSPIEITVDNLSSDEFKTWIEMVIANQVNGVGIFIGDAFIPMANIKYFEKA